MERSLAGVALVAVGGFCGAVARYGFDLVLGDVFGTFAVNVLGALLLGLLVTRLTDVRVQLFAGTGALSSFTTYSTFAGDAVALGTLAGTGYVAASYAVGIAAALAGLTLGRRL